MTSKKLVRTAVICVVLVCVSAIALLVWHQRTPEPGSIRIGALLELTGPIAPYAQSAKRGLELAASQINENGGIAGRSLDIIFEDCQSEPRVATLAANKVIFQDKVHAVVGFIGSSLLLAAAPLFNENHIVLISPGASSPQIREAGDFIFRTRASGRLEAETLAEYAIKDLNLRETAVLYVNNDYGLSWLKAFGERTSSLGGKVVAQEAFDQGANDMRTQLTKIKASGAKCLLILGYLDEIAVGLRQSVELGLNMQILTTVGVQNERIFELAGESVQGVIYSAADYDPVANPASQRFDRAYKARFGVSSDEYAANAYDALNLLAKAIGAVGADGQKIMSFLLKVKEYPGAGGTLSFDEKGDVVKPVLVKKVQGTDFLTIPHQSER